MRNVLKILGYLAGALLILLIVIIIYASATNYEAPMKNELTVEGAEGNTIITGSSASLLTWNIGYGGLGSQMDFFYDGGDKVRPDRESYRKYLDGILNVLSAYDTTDFIFLQEVDRNARRSYHINQQLMLSSVLENYSSVFATNYDVAFVPLPFTSPMGKVEAGLMTFSLCRPVEATRHALPDDYSWPKDLFMLDRCFILTRYQMQDEKELVLINTHNSAFDKDGKLRKQQLEKLRKMMISEYEKDNYVIAGGDWNLNPPAFRAGEIIERYKSKALGNPEENDVFPSGWKWAYDPRLPTNRDVGAPFKQQSTKTTIIDYFIVSPNIKVKTVKTIDLDFRYSDHQPVIMEVVFR